MVDNNYSVIKPVTNLKNISGLARTKRRKDGKKRQESNEDDDTQQQTANEQENKSVEKNIGGKITDNDQNEHSIDYRA